MSTETYRVALVVFCEASGADAYDAAYHAQRALTQQLSPNHARPALLNPVSFPNGVTLPPVVVHDVIEVGMAAGNGYLWTSPTSKAFPRKED